MLLQLSGCTFRVLVHIVSASNPCTCTCGIHVQHHACRGMCTHVYMDVQHLVVCVCGCMVVLVYWYSWYGACYVDANPAL